MTLMMMILLKKFRIGIRRRRKRKCSRIHPASKSVSLEIN
jgi:hypothetical protein